jgi:aspartyl-tRNA(Asn)/glutamyl-tRNA(Gln) amidotransferase subunit B
VGKGIADSRVAAAQIGAILDLISEGTISGKIAKELFEIVWGEGGDPRELVDRHGLKQVIDTGEIEKAIDEIIARNPDKVADLKRNPKALGWFVGQVMKAMSGKANPQAVNEILKRKLGL